MEQNITNTSDLKIFSENVKKTIDSLIKRIEELSKLLK